LNSIPRLFQRTWLQIVVVGGGLFFGAEQALKYTSDPNFFPTVILLGALVIPVAFVSFFYSQERRLDLRAHPDSPLMQVARCFVVGGAIGVIVAGTLEYATLVKLSVGALLAVALIEEAAKLILPVVVYIRAGYRSEIDGILFGITSGMGFAALETMGYGLVALIQSQGNVGVLEEVLLIRGLLSPAGHAAWTGLVCATLWRRREQTGRVFHPAVIGTFAIAVVLHFAWDLVSSTNIVAITYAGYVVVGGISITLLILRMREARKTNRLMHDNVEKV
jgi:protease PrsW